jgi:hypothetical protein
MKNRNLEIQVCKDFASLLYSNEKATIEETIFNLYMSYDEDFVNNDESIFKDLTLTYYSEILVMFLKKFGITNKDVILNVCLDLFKSNIAISLSENECDFFENYKDSRKKIYYDRNNYVRQNSPSNNK